MSETVCKSTVLKFCYRRKYNFFNRNIETNLKSNNYGTQMKPEYLQLLLTPCYTHDMKFK